MKTKLIAIIALAAFTSCISTPKGQVEENPEVLQTQPFDDGVPIQIKVERGEEYYHPILALWLEDIDGNFIETIYLSQSIATGTFRFGVAKGGEWMPGERRRPAALPYWGHRRGVKAPDGLYLPTPDDPIPDAISGATPKTSFVLNTTVKDGLKRFKVYMEVNQTWDWNHSWHNNLYPDDEEYKTSAQPALVYMVDVNLDNPQDTYRFSLIGHSHPSGKTGELFSDTTKHTTALKIIGDATLSVQLD